jgi:hypothetical protein
MLHGTSGARALVIFDFYYVTGSGKHAQTWQTTALKIQFEGTELPYFSLRPEGIWDKVTDWYGHQDIDFDTHPAFSRKYHLRGDDEAQIRAVFTPQVLGYFEAHPGLNLEAYGRTIMFYRLGKRVSPKDIRDFLASGLELMPLLTDS